MGETRREDELGVARAEDDVRQHRHREDRDGADDDREILLADRLHRHTAHARPRKDGLCNNGTAQEDAEVEADDRHRRSLLLEGALRLDRLAVSSLGGWSLISADVGAVGLPLRYPKL